MILMRTLRRHGRILVLIALCVPISACASRPESGFLTPVGEASPGAADHTILVATTRQRDPRPGTLFNGERAGSLDYASIEVCVPPNHVQSTIEWPATPPGDPKTDFVTRKVAYLDGDRQFIRTLNAQLATRPKGSRGVFLFIHGYNTMFAEGLYRFTQIVHDSHAPGVPVLFTWASRGKLTDYVYDNNSATAARDDLVHTLRLLLASDADQVNILAHSMGNWVTVEAFRQIKISGDLRHANKVGDILLAAPDIDFDVFKSQMRSFPEARKPFYVVISKDDKALMLSKFIAGGEKRLGANDNISELQALGAHVIDLTDVTGTDAANHDKFLLLANIGPQLHSVLAAGVRAGSSPTVVDVAADNPASALALLGGTVLTAPIKIFAGQ